MGRHNDPTRRIVRRDPMEIYDTEYVFRPDRPDVRLFIRHSRKLIEINVDAEPGAWMTLEYE